MRFAIALVFFASPAFAQAPPPRQSVADLQSAWQVRAYGEAQAIKALDAIIKELEATAKERDDLRKELDAIKAKEPPK